MIATTDYELTTAEIHQAIVAYVERRTGQEIEEATVSINKSSEDIRVFTAYVRVKKETTI